jgi:hypothetical protein
VHVRGTPHPTPLRARTARIARRAALLAALAGAATVAPVTAQAQILWSADAETGDLSQWAADGGGDELHSGTGATRVVASPARGSHAFEMSISDADGAHGDQAVRLHRWRTAAGDPLPEEGYYSAWYQLPRSHSGMRWWNVFQFKVKQTPEEESVPTWVLNVGDWGDGRMRFYLSDHIAGVTRAESGIDIPVGRWFHVEAYLLQRTDGTGRIAVWQDGARIIDLAGVPTTLPSTDPDPLRVGFTNYTDQIVPSSATVYLDDAAISTERLGPPEPPKAPELPDQPEPAPAATSPSRPSHLAGRARGSSARPVLRLRARAGRYSLVLLARGTRGRLSLLRTARGTTRVLARTRPLRVGAGPHRPRLVTHGARITGYLNGVRRVSRTDPARVAARAER